MSDPPRERLAPGIDHAVLEAISAPNKSMAPIRWYGGKGRMVSKLRCLLPRGKVYVEPFSGAASLFWTLKPRPVEVLTDLNREIINLFRVLQDTELFERLAHRLIWTPYSLDEFRRAIASGSNDPVDRAWSVFVKHAQGFAGLVGTEGNWSRGFTSSCGMAAIASKWRRRLRCLHIWHRRLSRVQLDCRDALEVIKYWDSGGYFDLFRRFFSLQP